jgi:hypothetical protein
MSVRLDAYSGDAQRLPEDGTDPVRGPRRPLLRCIERLRALLECARGGQEVCMVGLEATPADRTSRARGVVA